MSNIPIPGTLVPSVVGGKVVHADNVDGTIPSSIDVVLPSGSTVAASGIEARGAAVVAGVANLDGTPLIESVIEDGDGTVTLWSYAVPVSTIAEVILDARFTADDGTAGKDFTGKLWCVVKRQGSGAAAIIAEGTGHPYHLTDAGWEPTAGFFNLSGNTLRLQCEDDADCTIQIRGTIAISTTDTSADAAPPVNDDAWYDAQINTIVGSANVIEHYIATATSYTGWASQSGNHALANTGTSNFSAGTIGAGGHAAIDSPTAREACLRNADLGTAIKTVVFVAESPTLPDTNYNVLGGPGASGALEAKMRVDAAGTAIGVQAGWTPYVDGVQTSVVPQDGNVHTFAFVNNSSILTDLETGWNDAPNSTFTWRAPVGAILACSTALTAQNLLDITAEAQAFFA